MGCPDRKLIELSRNRRGRTFSPLLNGWDKGELAADAPYPVRMGDLRMAARALALAGVRQADKGGAT